MIVSDYLANDSEDVIEVLVWVGVWERALDGKQVPLVCDSSIYLVDSDFEYP